MDLNGLYKKKKANPKKLEVQPWFAAVVAKSQTGKSTFLGTSGKDTIILHTDLESHGVRSAQLMAEKSFPDAFIHGINIERVTEEDQLDGSPIKEGKLGDRLKADQILAKLDFITKNIPKEVGCVCLDSATDMARILKASTPFVKACTNGKGVYNNFGERDAYVYMYKKLLSLFKDLKLAGKDIFITMSAKDIKDDPEENAIQPDLHMFGVTDFVIQSFDDVIPLTRRVDAEGVEQVIIDPEMRVEKVQKTEEGTVRNKMSTRKRFISKLGSQLDIPPSLADIAGFTELLAELREEASAQEK